MKGPELAERLELIFEALANANRRRILEVLAEQPWPSGDVASRLSCAWPTASRHLGILEKARLIRRSRGYLTARSIFELDNRGLDEARQWLEPLRGSPFPW